MTMCWARLLGDELNTWKIKFNNWVQILTLSSHNEFSCDLAYELVCLISNSTRRSSWLVMLSML